MSGLTQLVRRLEVEMGELRAQNHTLSQQVENWQRKGEKAFREAMALQHRVTDLTQQVEEAREGLRRIESHVAIPLDGSTMPPSETLAAWIEGIARDTLNAMGGE